MGGADGAAQQKVLTTGQGYDWVQGHPIKQSLRLWPPSCAQSRHSVKQVCFVLAAGSSRSLEVSDQYSPSRPADLGLVQQDFELTYGLADDT